MVAGLADELAVMYAGCIVETGSVDAVLDRPVHPYTRGLIRSVPSGNRRGERLQQIPGTTPGLLNRPAGCAFRTRCAHADVACRADPPLAACRPEHASRCFHPQPGPLGTSVPAPSAVALA